MTEVVQTPDGVEVGLKLERRDFAGIRRMGRLAIRELEIGRLSKYAKQQYKGNCYSN